jgi:hypothetical protein
LTINFTQIAENWNDAEGYACLWSKNGSTAFFHWPSQASALLAAARHTNKHESAFIGWCLFETPSRLATAASVVPGILFDVDIAGAGHAASNYPATEEEALTLVQQSRLPNPTTVIRSGGGLYLHYLFPKPFVVQNDVDRVRIAALLKGAFQVLNQTFDKAGRKLDNVSDLARITRPLGAINHKYGSEVQVTILSADGPRQSVDEWEALVGSADKASDYSASEQHPTDDEEGKGSFALVERHCAFIRQMLETPEEVSEPEWLAAASIASKCEDGEERFHNLSKRDQHRYSEGEAAGKLRHAKLLRPRTCRSVESDLGFADCQTCPFKASNFKSPYALAFGTPELLALQSQYVFSTSTDQYHCVVRDEPPLAHQSFTNAYAHVLAKPHLAFTRDKRSPKVRAVDYIPGDPGLIVDQAGVSVLNGWQHGGLDPEEGSCEVVLDHLAYLLPNAEHRDWVLNYLAHLLQKPQVKIKHGVMLIGGQGVGKSFLNEILKGLFGSRNVCIDDSGLHAGDYRMQLGNKQVLVIEEMATASKWETSNALKPWFTSDKVSASEKYVRAHDVRSPRGIFIFTNHALPAVFEKGERRNAVFRIDSLPRPTHYYDRLWTDGLHQISAFKAWLFQRDISIWSPNAHPPMTDAKEEIIESSRTPVATDLQELIHSERITRDLITMDEILSLLHRFSMFGAPTYSRSQVRKALAELGCRKLNKTKLANGQLVDLWAVKNTPKWLPAEHAERKAHYEGRVTSTGITLGLIDALAS